MLGTCKPELKRENPFVSVIIDAPAPIGYIGLDR
jgi:hypothetical protein